jgi:hypothetical protein
MAVKAARKKNPAAVALGRKDSNASDDALLTLLKRLKAANEPTEIRRLSNQIERVIFHKQYKNA